MKVKGSEITILGCAALTLLLIADTLFSIRFYFAPGSTGRAFFFSEFLVIPLFLAPLVVWIAYRKGKQYWSVSQKRLYFWLTLLPFAYLIQFGVGVVLLAYTLD